MAHYTLIRDGMSAAGEKNLSNLAIAFISAAGGVVGSNDYLIQAQASPNNTIFAGTGRAFIPTADGTMVYATLLDATQNITISPNTSGNPRIDAIVVYINKSVSPDSGADNVAGFYDVIGTPAGSPSAPNNAAILAAIGASNPYIVLAYVAVANGFTSISSANITDERTFSKISGADTIFQSTFSNFIKSGLVVPTSASLTSICSSGVLYYNGINVQVASDGGHLYTASKDTYVDVSNSGIFNYQNVANGATAPTLTASSIRIAKVVTGAGSVTSVIQYGLDNLNNLIYPTNPLAGPLLIRLPYASDQYDNGNSGISITIDWSKGDRQKVTITGICTLAYSNARAGQILTLDVNMDGTGHAVTLPTTKWPKGIAGTFAITASAKNTLVTEYDGTDYKSQLADGWA
jgi:hypothetical protein